MTASGKNFLTFGILNVTPDSFSDGGLYTKPEDALEKALQLFEDGADFVDAGAESTKPGAQMTPELEEWRRLEPFLQLANERGLLPRLSIDTMKFTIMKRAAKMGAAFINCVGPIPEEHELKELIGIKPDLGFVATHMHGVPETMQLTPLGPRSAKNRVSSYFENCLEELLKSGFRPEKIFLDPGIGFGKSDAANLTLLANTHHWAKTFNLAIGVSRKGFIGRLFGGESKKDRDALSKAIETSAVFSGAKMIRTHDVRGLAKISSVIEEAFA
jgi:dihydropteroate synthase